MTLWNAKAPSCDLQAEPTLPGVLSDLQATLEDLRQALAAGTASGPTWLSLKTAAIYCGPLPTRRVGGKWLVHRDELDTWLRSFPKAGEDLDRLVDEVLADMNDKRGKS